MRNYPEELKDAEERVFALEKQVKTLEARITQLEQENRELKSKNSVLQSLKPPPEVKVVANPKTWGGGIGHVQ